MNRIYRSIWNPTTGTCVAASENAKSYGDKSPSGATAVAGGGARFALKGLAVSLLLAFGSNAWALPTGGAVSAGSASIASGAGKMTIGQSSQNVAINWQSFSIGGAEAVRFVQPNSTSVALNRVLGADPSSILGSLAANGKVFLLNPNGILFGQGAQVNVGGLVASTLNLTDSDFMGGRYKFAGAGGGAILNQGSINAEGGYVALLGANVSNEGTISAKFGTVALAAGSAMTLDMAGDGLLNVTVDEGAVNALVQNGGLIRAHGGQVLMSAQAAGLLLKTVVNNTGIIEAQSIEHHNGTIKLLGDMQSGTVNVGGTLDASAPNGGNGGFIETSAAHVDIANDAKVTTAAPMGLTGTWLIDPLDFIIAPIGGNISGATLSAQLVNNNVTIDTVAGPGPGNGDIFVNDAVSWNGAAAPGASTTLSLNGLRDVNVNFAITAVSGNLVVCCGRDANVNAAITTTNGSVLLSAGNDVNMNAAITATNGNIAMCAGDDVNVNATITLTNSGSIPAQGLGLPLGLFLSAGNNGSGPGVAGGTVIFNPLSPATVTRSQAPVTDVTIHYNPVSYTAPTDYSLNLIRNGAVTLNQRMLVFPGVLDKTFDGTSVATLAGFKSTALSGIPAGVTLVAGPGSTANFETPDVGVGKPVTFSGFSLDPVGANTFALPLGCCAPIVGRTTGNIIPAVVVVVPGVIPVPPVVVVPGVIVPVVVAPGVIPVPPIVVAPGVVVVPVVVAPGGIVPVVVAPDIVVPVVVAPVLVAPDVVAPVLVAPAVLPLIQNSVGLVPLRELPGLNLSVLGEGVRMPPMQLAQTPPPPPPVPPAPVIVPPVTPPVRPAPVIVPPETPRVQPPPVVVPPPRPPRQDRN